MNCPEVTKYLAWIHTPRGQIDKIDRQLKHNLGRIEDIRRTNRKLKAKRAAYVKKERAIRERKKKKRSRK